MIPHDLIVFYTCEQGKLVPLPCARRRLRTIPFAGDTHWPRHRRVGCSNKEPIINGEPAAETKHLANPSCVSVLEFALSVPLEGRDGVAGVLSLLPQGEGRIYQGSIGACSWRQLPSWALSVENALELENARDSAGTDFLTGLPNARSICTHLSNELGSPPFAPSSHWQCSCAT